MNNDKNITMDQVRKFWNSTQIHEMRVAARHYSERITYEFGYYDGFMRAMARVINGDFINVSGELFLNDYQNFVISSVGYSIEFDSRAKMELFKGHLSSTVELMKDNPKYTDIHKLEYSVAKAINNKLNLGVITEK